MLCLDNEIDSALKNDAVLVGLLGGERIYGFNKPGDKDAPYPEVVYEEISNVPVFASDDVESASRITYRISVCTEANLTEIINAVERVMISINFIRHSSEPIRSLPISVKGKVFLFITMREVI